MRYIGIEDDVFINEAGVARVLHGMRDIPDLPVGMEYNKPLEMEFDELAEVVYGAGGAMYSYMIRDANIERLLLNGFKEKEIINVKIPREI